MYRHTGGGTIGTPPLISGTISVLGVAGGGPATSLVLRLVEQ